MRKQRDRWDIGENVLEVLACAVDETHRLSLAPTSHHCPLAFVTTEYGEKKKAKALKKEKAK